LSAKEGMAILFLIPDNRHEPPLYTMDTRTSDYRHRPFGCQPSAFEENGACHATFLRDS
jgi:hypothetical protein